MSFFDIDSLLMSRILLAVLLHFVWQATVISLLVVFVGSLIRRSSSLRYVGLVGGLLLTLAAPLVTAGFYLANPTLVSVEATVGSTAALNTNLVQTDDLVANSSPLFFLRTQLGNQFQLVFQWFENSRQLWLSVWLVGVLVLALRLLISLESCLRLRRLAIPLAAEIEQVADLVKTKLNVPKKIIVRGSNEITQAIATGVIRPMVLIPMSWLTQLPTQSIEAIIAHELAHIRRWDLWVNLLQRITETVFFFHPLVWWISRKINVEREICCDELAIRCTGNRLAYAETLAWVAEMKNLNHSNLQFGTAIRGDNKMNLLRRIRTILEPSAVDGHSVLRLPVVLLCMATTLAFVSIAFSVTTGPPVALQDEHQHQDSDPHMLVVQGKDFERVDLSTHVEKTAEGDFVWLVKTDDSENEWVQEETDKNGEDTFHFHVQKSDGDAKDAVWVQENGSHKKTGDAYRYHLKSSDGDHEKGKWVELKVVEESEHESPSGVWHLSWDELDSDLTHEEMAKQLRKIADQLSASHGKAVRLNVKKGDNVIILSDGNKTMERLVSPRDVDIELKEGNKFVERVPRPLKAVVKLKDGNKLVERVVEADVVVELEKGENKFIERVVSPRTVVVELEEGNKLVERAVDLSKNEIIKLKDSRPHKFIYEVHPKKDGQGNLQVVVETEVDSESPAESFDVLVQPLDESKKDRRQNIWVEKVELKQDPRRVELSVDSEDDAKLQEIISDLKKQLKALRKEVRELKSDSSSGPDQPEKGSSVGEGFYRLKLREVPKDESSKDQPDDQDQANKDVEQFSLFTGYGK